MAKAVIVGHSLGGLVGVHLAAEYEERILGLVAIAPSVPSLRARERFLARIEEVKTSECAFAPFSIPPSPPSQEDSHQ